MMQTPASPTGTLPTRIKAGWAAGSLGTVSQLYLVNLMLLYFLTEHAGLAPALAGGLILAGRLYDVVTDPLAGALSDRTRSRWGRRRPWMFAGAWLAGLSCVALFAVPEGASPLAAGALVTAALLLYFTGYTLFNVPYLAMPAEMTADYDERTSLMSWRVLFVSLAGIVGSSLAPALVKWLGSDRRAYLGMAVVMGAIVTAAMLCAVFSTARAPRTAHVASAAGWRAWLATLAGNRPFLLLIAIKFLHLLSLACISASLFFFVLRVLGRDELTVAYFGLAMALGTIAALPAWVRLATRYGKPRAFFAAVVLQGLAALTWLLADAAEPLAMFIARSLALGAAGAGVILFGQALLPDTIQHDHVRTGLRREGIYAALYSLAEKSSFALAPFIVGALLSALGYAPGAAALAPDTARAVYIGIGVLPACFYFASLPLIARYRHHDAAIRAAGAAP